MYIHSLVIKSVTTKINKSYSAQRVTFSCNETIYFFLWACILLLTELIVIDVPKVQYVEHDQCRFVFFKTLVQLPLYLQVKRVFYMLRTCPLVSAC